MTERKQSNIKKRALLLLLSFVLVVFSLIPLSIAWFGNDSTDHEFEAHMLMGYFKSGTGISTDPYIISQPKHFYNLAWLQNIGAFQGTTPYFQIDPDAENGILDMAGYLKGEENYTGAIPPIGNSTYPFVGVIDGGGVTIKNLWVSTDAADWYENPGVNYSVGNDVGLFGKIGPGSDIKNFYLENIEVTTTVEDENATLGIVAGYVDGNISNIGVIGAKLSFKSGTSVTVASEYSLIGHKGEYVIWGDLPSDWGSVGSGGELVVIPKPVNNSTTISSAVDLSPNAVPGHAYYVGNLTISTPSPQPGSKGVYKYVGTSSADDDVISFESFNTTTHQITAEAVKKGNRTIVDIDLSDDGNWKDLGIEPEFVSLATQGSTKYAIKSTVPPIITADTVSGHGQYPTNCIWFKPIQSGTVTIAFSKENNPNTYDYTAIYRYRRDPATGKLDTTVPVKEIILAMNKDGVGNGDIVYFDLSISDTEATSGYEYAIGRSSKSTAETTVGFFFLKLAGVNISNGTVGALAPDGKPYRLLKDIDFVESNEVDLTSDTWKMHKSILTLSGTHSHNTGGYAAIYYDVGTVTVSGKNVEGVVYKNDTGLTVKQVIQTDPEAANNTSFTYGPYETRKPLTETG